MLVNIVALSASGENVTVGVQPGQPVELEGRYAFVSWLTLLGMFGYWLVTMAPRWAITARRLRDAGHSALWVLLRSLAFPILVMQLFVSWICDALGIPSGWSWGLQLAPWLLLLHLLTRPSLFKDAARPARGSWAGPGGVPQQEPPDHLAPPANQ